MIKLLGMAITPILLLLVGCAGEAGPVMSASQFTQQFPPSQATIQPGEKIRLALFGDDALTGDYVVAADGTISLPLIGAVPATNLTAGALEDAIEIQLRKGFYSTPQVTVQVLDVQPVYVLGEVNKPGSFAYVPDLTLSKAAALAGGYSYWARTDRVAIRRARAQQEVVVAMDQALALAPGDTVRVLAKSF